MKQNWTFANEKIKTGALFSDLEHAMRKILISRGVEDEQQKESFLHPDYARDLHDPFKLDGMKRAVEIVMQMRDQDKIICIYGDYDADGVTSAVLLTDFFNQIGINNFCYIPDRNKEGYGLNNKAIDYIFSKEAALIVSVDCGVSNVDEVDYAKKIGMEVVVLDHHHVPNVMPKAGAIVNPKKKGDLYPEKELAGVGVAYKFVQAMASKLKDYDSEQLKWFLDLVAIGTVADCMTLKGENRTLVKFGLIVLSKTKRIGLKQLFHVGKISIDQHAIPSSYQIGFQIGPRINAAGRMDHANIAFNLLLAKENEESKARLLALEIEDKNKHRKKVTEVIVKETQQRLEQKINMPSIVIETSPNWELGVIGLAAGKIADKYNRPTILLREEEKIFRGSGRSVEGLNLIDVIEKHSMHVEQFGGHAQALGIKLKKGKFEKFSKAIEKEVKNIKRQAHVKTICIDVEVELEEINKKLMKELALLEPFGAKNEKPVFFSRRLQIKDARVVGNGEKHLKLWLTKASDPSCNLECIGFRFAEEFSHLKTGDRINVVFNLEEDNWNGLNKTQAVLIDIEKV